MFGKVSEGGLRGVPESPENDIQNWVYTHIFEVGRGSIVFIRFLVVSLIQQR